MVQNMKRAKKVSKVLCAQFTKYIYVNEVLVKVDFTCFCFTLGYGSISFGLYFLSSAIQKINHELQISISIVSIVSIYHYQRLLLTA